MITCLFYSIDSIDTNTLLFILVYSIYICIAPFGVIQKAFVAHHMHKNQQEHDGAMPLACLPDEKQKITEKFGKERTNVSMIDRQIVG